MSYNKLNASSILYVDGLIIGRDDADGHCACGFQYGSADAVWCGSYSYDGGNYMTLIGISGVLVGHTTTGAQTLKLIYVRLPNSKFNRCPATKLYFVYIFPATTR